MTSFLIMQMCEHVRTRKNMKECRKFAMYKYRDAKIERKKIFVVKNNAQNECVVLEHQIYTS